MDDAELTKFSSVWSAAENACEREGYPSPQDQPARYLCRVTTRGLERAARCRRPSISPREGEPSPAPIGRRSLGRRELATQSSVGNRDRPPFNLACRFQADAGVRVRAGGRRWETSRAWGNKPSQRRLGSGYQRCASTILNQARAIAVPQYIVRWGTSYVCVSVC